MIKNIETVSHPHTFEKVVDWIQKVSSSDAKRNIYKLIIPNTDDMHPN